MPTKAELQAENDRLRAELEAAKTAPAAPEQKDDITIGELYNLSIGQAEVIGFYVEDDVEKVQFYLRLFDPLDGLTVREETKTIASMPPEKFHRLQADWRKDQQARDIEARKYARREARLKAAREKTKADREARKNANA